MAAVAPGNSHCPLFKLKLGDLTARHRTHACGAPERLDARLVADANEGWHSSDLKDRLAVAAEVGIEVVEQPLHAQADMHLTDLASPVLLCADEAAPLGTDLFSRLADRYQAVRIKLDKTRGLTGALTAIADARKAGCRIMIGPMVAISLSMAPAALLGSAADWVDLDSPLLLARDRPSAMTIAGGELSPPAP